MLPIIWSNKIGLSGIGLLNWFANNFVNIYCFLSVIESNYVRIKQNIDACIIILNLFNVRLFHFIVWKTGNKNLF